MTRRLPVALLALVAALAAAQPQPADSSDVQALRQRLNAAPIPGAGPQSLRRLFDDKVEAARRLGDMAALERVLREAIEALPQDGRWPNDLGLLMRDGQRLDDALRLFDAAIARAQRPGDRLLYLSNRLSVPVRRAPETLLRDAADLRRQAQDLLTTLAPGTERLNVMRVLAATYTREADAHGRRGRYAEALAARTAADQGLGAAFEALVSLSPPSATQRQITTLSWGVALRDLAFAQLRVGLTAQAEATLERLQRLLREQGMVVALEASTQHLTAILRLRRGEYDAAERHLRLSQQALDRQRLPRSHPFQTARSRDLMLTLWAARRHDEGLRELQAMDQALRADLGAPQRGRYAFERGLTLLGAGQAADAAVEFEALYRFNRGELGSDHFYSLQAQALQGAALWRASVAAGAATSREAAARLLQTGVLGMLAPRNVDFMDDVYARRRIQALVFQAYLEAMVWRGGDSAASALGVADRLLAGATGQAMTDAAIRSAARQPGLAELVRREQDQRLLVQALAEALRDGDSTSGSDNSDSDEAQSLRQRLSEGEQQLKAARDELRQRFPEYDRLLRPPLATPAAVARALARDEVLLLALPTESTLFLWALVADGPPRVVQVDLPRDRLQQQVQQLRAGLDFGLTQGRVPRFDRALSHQLHQQLLAPVAAALADRRQLVVATTGPLAALPFAALLASPAPDSSDAWVARQLATSQVHSVAAWLALRHFPAARRSAEPLMAWADPAYPSAASASTPAGRSSGGSSAASLPALPETRDEARAIAQALRARPEQDLLLGSRATRDSVLAASRSGELARKRVVVFAAHGLTAGDLPGLAQPALALAPPPGSGDALAGLVGLDDILGLKLNADWVVLSACNTAAGDGRSEEALSGLARGFLHAGSRSLLVTHWAVETESAKLLTTATFEHHAAHPSASKAESLRQAMLQVMANPKYAQPAYWAPYALVGDGAR